MSNGQQHAVGASVPRVDGHDKVTGAALYIDDYPREGVLYGKTLRSIVPRGRLRAIERDPAFDWSDITVVTAAQIAGPNIVALIEEDQPFLVPIDGEIQHAEEPLALVAAPTAERAAEALKHLHANVEPLPAVVDLASALAEDAPRILKQLTLEKGLALEESMALAKGLALEKELGSGDDKDQQIEAALAAAHLVVEGTYETGAQEQMYIEPQGMEARWEQGTCFVSGSLQCPYYVHRALTSLLQLPAERVVITQAVTGGGFGGKEEYPSILAGHAALLAQHAQAPVRMVYDRSEDIAATTKRHPARIRHRLGFDSDGKIVAADVELWLDGGAYVTLSPVVLSRAVLHASGPYCIPVVRIRGEIVATNTPPAGAFRGFGAPQATFAYERQMQKAATALGIEPFELRRRNLLRVGDITATGQQLTVSVGSDAVVDAVEAASKQPAPDAGTTPPRLAPLRGSVRRGRGLAVCFHGAGFTGSGEEHLKGRASVVAHRDGSFEVLTTSTEIGQGARTMFTQIAADALGVGLDQVALSEPSTAAAPDSGPTVASRTCMVVGGVVREAAQRVHADLVDYANQQGLDAADLVAVAQHHGQARGDVAHTVTYTPPRGIVWDDATYTGSAYPVYGWAACLVDVAVDEDTYEVTVERCIHAIDVGKAIHPTIVQGQIEGGTLQALGWALWEHVVQREGRVVNTRMTDCIIPTFLEAPTLETLIIEEPYPDGPYGAKGIGEIPMDGPAAAVAGAVEDALGVPIDQLPILPERILEWL